MHDEHRNVDVLKTGFSIKLATHEERQTGKKPKYFRGDSICRKEWRFQNYGGDLTAGRQMRRNDGSKRLTEGNDGFWIDVLGVHEIVVGRVCIAIEP